MPPRKVRVPLVGGRGQVDLDPRATEGAVLGINLFNRDGSLVTVEQLVAAGVSLEGIPTTDALPEGTRNLYFTDARADARIAAHVALADPHTQYQPNLQFKDEGSNEGAAGAINTVDFVGAGVDVSESGGVLTVTVSGGGAGSAGQEVYTQDSTNKTGTTTIPYDNTIPQSSEGTAYSELDTTITPTSAGSDLEITVNLAVLNCSANNTIIAAIFRDSDADAIDVGFMAPREAAYSHGLVMRVRVAAGSTDPTTFKVRFGANAAGTTRINAEGTNAFGGVIYSSMLVREILP